MNEDMASFSDELEQALASLTPALQAVAATLEWPEFHNACAAGELELVRALLEAGIGPDAYPCTESEDDEPPLTWVARYRDQSSPEGLHVARLLIAHGAREPESDVERSSFVDEGTPLFAALLREDVSLSRLLIAAGADPDLALEYAEDREVELFQALQEPPWTAPVDTVPRYYIAFDEDQAIRGVGTTLEGALVAAAQQGSGSFETLPASERLIARFLSGDEVSWVGDSAADLDDSDDCDEDEDT